MRSQISVLKNCMLFVGLVFIYSVQADQGSVLFTYEDRQVFLDAMDGALLHAKELYPEKNEAELEIILAYLLIHLQI